MTSGHADDDSQSLGACYAVLAAGVCAALQVGKLPPAIGALQDALQLSLLEAGFLLSLVQFAGMTMAIFTGSWVDGVGLRRSMVLGLSLLALASMAGGYATAAGPLLVLRAVEGFGFLWVALPAPALLRRLTPPGRLQRMLGLWGAYMPFGIALGLLAGPWWIQAAGWRSWWWLNAALTMGMAVVLALVRAPGGALAAPRMGHALSWMARLRRTLRHGGPWLVAFAFAAYSSQWLAVVAFLPHIYESAGVSVGERSVLTATAAAANLIGNILGGLLLQRGVAAAKLLMAGFLAMGLFSAAAFAGADGGVETGVVAALRFGAVLAFSAFGGLIPTTLFSLALQLAPDEHTVATTVGWMQQWSSLGQFMGPPLVAWVAERAGGWQWTWIATGLTSLTGLVLCGLIGALVRRGHPPG